YGQGNWAYYSTSTGTNPSNYKINAARPTGLYGPPAGQALQIKGAASTTASRYLYQDVSEQWAVRDAGVNIVWIAYDAYMSSATSSSGNRTGGYLFGTDSTGTVGGMMVGMAMEYGTVGTSTKQRSVFGYAYYTSGTSTGNYRFKLSEQALSSGGTSPLAASGGWTKFAMNWNKVTGQVNWYYSVDGGATYTGFYVNGAGAGLDNFMEWDFYAQQASGTTTANAIFGDFWVFATPDSCPSDLDRNGLVDTADISVLLLDFGDCQSCAGDLDGNGLVDTADVSLLLLDFGSCP
ncbi:MAG: hypothetical protein EBU31_15060, partial [Proteobacteria bacterium]|nr:hypothetical protein [Pseudomonadota bacterium]